jgi:hypothetical protein
MTDARRLAAILAADVGVREHRDGTSETAPRAASHPEIGRAHQAGFLHCRARWPRRRQSRGGALPSTRQDDLAVLAPCGAVGNGLLAEEGGGGQFPLGGPRAIGLRPNESWPSERPEGLPIAARPCDRLERGHHRYGQLGNIPRGLSERTIVASNRMARFDVKHALRLAALDASIGQILLKNS